MLVLKIILNGIFIYLILLYLVFGRFLKRRALEKNVRREEDQLRRFGFRRIAGGYYILGSGATGIYTRKEARATMENRINPRTQHSHEHTHPINPNTAGSRHPSR